MQRSDQYRSHGSSGARCALIVALAALALTACGSDEPQVVAPVQQVKREKVAEDPTAKMARAVTVGKSSVPVNLKYDILSKPMVGVPVEIDLAVIPSVGADSMTIAYSGSTGLTLMADSAPSIEVVKAGKIEHLKLVVQADQEAVFYVTVTATIYTAGTSVVRNFAIPLIMSAPTAAAEPTATAAVAPKKS